MMGLIYEEPKLWEQLCKEQMRNEPILPTFTYNYKENTMSNDMDTFLLEDAKRKYDNMLIDERGVAHDYPEAIKVEMWETCKAQVLADERSRERKIARVKPIVEYLKGYIERKGNSDDVIATINAIQSEVGYE